jgi:hypothetical protein
VFGYDNVEVRGPDGTRSHVERRINEAEASVVRRIFGMSAGGSGLTAIAKALNIDGVPTPRPQRGRPAAWIASSVRAVLIDPSIAERWSGIGRASATRGGKSGRLSGRKASGCASSLRGYGSSLRNCGQRHTDRWRGGGFSSHLRTHGTGARRFLARFYGCTSYWERGATVCSNGLVADMATIDAEVLATIQDDVLRPNIVERAVALAFEELAPDREEAHRARLAAESAEVSDEHAAIAAAIAHGGDVQTIVALVNRLQALEARRAELTSANRLAGRSRHQRHYTGWSSGYGRSSPAGAGF